MSPLIGHLDYITSILLLTEVSKFVTCKIHQIHWVSSSWSHPSCGSPERGCDGMIIQLHLGWRLFRTDHARTGSQKLMKVKVKVEVYLVLCGKSNEGKWPVLNRFWMSLIELKKFYQFTKQTGIVFFYKHIEIRIKVHSIIIKIWIQCSWQE